MSAMSSGCDGPFPWLTNCASSSRETNDAASSARLHRLSTSNAKWVRLIGNEMLRLNRTSEVFDKITNDPALSYRLPPPNATAGTVIHHACEVFEGVHLHHKPMTFKFGFTHCAHFRWHNKKFGYAHDCVDKFAFMIVVFAAADPVGPAFLEASLIRQYGSCLS